MKMEMKIQQTNPLPVKLPPPLLSTPATTEDLLTLILNKPYLPESLQNLTPKNLLTLPPQTLKAQYPDLFPRLAALQKLFQLAAQPEKEEVKKITSPDDAAALLWHLRLLPHEEIHVILLNANNEVITTMKILQGGIDNVTLSYDTVIRPALLFHAPRFIMVHNHPSGNPEPSPMDRNTTQDIKNAAKAVGLEFLDHIIIAGNTFSSLKKLNML